MKIGKLERRGPVCAFAMVIFVAVHFSPAKDRPVGMEVRISPATGVARWVMMDGGVAIPVPAVAGQRLPNAFDFFSQYGDLFGMGDAEQQLHMRTSHVDRMGQTHTRFQQMHEGLSVFGAMMVVHGDALGQIHAVNGTFVPDIKVSSKPTIAADAAAITAVTFVDKQELAAGGLVALGSELMIYRTNLDRGLPGKNHLVYRVEVGNGMDVREFVFVDAHDGLVVDQLTGTHDVISRRVYIGNTSNLVWSEGDATPFGDSEVDNIIEFTEDTYNLFSTVSGGTFLSWDGVDGLLHGVASSTAISCPNAQWVGSHTRYCTGVTPDDVVGHEWAHAYTDSTHDLIYRWQSGALNESYSDIFGEVVDLLNGAGTDSPDVVRAVGDCSTFGGGHPPSLEINSPGGISGGYLAGGAAFNPSAPFTVTADVELVNDASGTVTDGCEPFVGFTPGRIALVDRGTCGYIVKATNAATANAAGVIVANNISDNLVAMIGSGVLGIPTVFVAMATGDSIKAALGGSTVNATITLPVGPMINSVRWMVGEDSAAFGGPIRDMWNPNCYVDPVKVVDPYYYCGPVNDDQGGVHNNSAIPNHGFALLVDGGTFNGQAIASIGLTRAAHIYWRAQSVYQVPYSNFIDHAEALEQSCDDLIGATLTALSTDNPVPVNSADVITSTHCMQVAKMTLALQMRTAPTACNFQTLLSPNAPALCGGGSEISLFMEDWESGIGTWTVGTREVTNPATFDTPDWAVVGGLPSGRSGSAAFVADPVLGNCGSDLETGVLFLDSPMINLPLGATDLHVAFDHWVATEFGWDGTNVKISVNAGPFAVIPSAAFDFNPYNTTLNAGGNDNPMAGEPAFSGSDDGSNAGSWGQSQIDLTGIAGAGDAIRLRFEMGMDGCNGLAGWYVDDVRVFTCSQCAEDANCHDFDVCTFDQCVASSCEFEPNIYGDVDHNGTISLFDLFCVLDGFSDVYNIPNCSAERVDIEPCAGNGTVNLADLFAVLNAFNDVDPCCNP